MTDKHTLRMLDAYEQLTTPTNFLTGLFQTPAKNFYSQEKVTIDVQRSGEPVSIVVQDLSTGGRANALDLYTNKEYTPPIHDEFGSLNSFQLNLREAGNTTFDDINFQEVATLKALVLAVKMEEKIVRAIELQASQVLQTGKLTLIDSTGASIYELDYKPKTNHFVSAGTAWNAAGATPVADIESLANQIRTDGKKAPDQLIMGSTAFDAFISNDDVKSRFDNRRYELGTIAPVPMRSDGGIYKGVVNIGNYKFDVWTYAGYYDHPQTGTNTAFIDPAKVVVRASQGRLDATYGAIPTFGNPAASILPFLPPRISSATLGRDIFMNAWLEPNRRQLTVSSSSRPLLIPTAIDTFGALATGV